MDSLRRRTRENSSNGYVSTIRRLQIQVLTIYQCTPCDTVISYTNAYTITDAEKLLRRIEERNTAIKYKLPPPRQEKFLPQQIVAPVSQTSRECANEHCSKSRNKSCTFFLCKQCCCARPVLDKSCIIHHRNTSSLQSQAAVIISPSQPTSPPQSTPPLQSVPPPRSILPLQSVPQSTQVAPPLPVLDNCMPAENSHLSRLPETLGTLVPASTQPVRHQSHLQHSAGPLLEERIAAPRSDFASSGANISRRRAEGLQMSRNQCSIHIWLEVCPVVCVFRPPYSSKLGWDSSCFIPSGSPAISTVYAT